MYAGKTEPPNTPYQQDEQELHVNQQISQLKVHFFLIRTSPILQQEFYERHDLKIRRHKIYYVHHAHPKPLGPRSPCKIWLLAPRCAIFISISPISIFIAPFQAAFSKQIAHYNLVKRVFLERKLNPFIHAIKIAKPLLEKKATLL